MATKSNEIKKALKKAFPKIKFSVTYKNTYGYTVTWQDGLIEGATSEAVEAIADNWSTETKNELGGGDCYFSGDSVRYDHEITDLDWKEFVIGKVLETASNGVYYDKDWDSFRNKNGKHTHWENERYNEYLYNGIKSDLNSHDAICDRDFYYREEDQKKIDELIEEERILWSKTGIPSVYCEYLHEETDKFIVTGIKLVGDRPDYTIYNREIVYNISGEDRKIKPLYLLKFKPEFTVFNKETKQDIKCDLDQVRNIVDPILPLAVVKTQIRFKNSFKWNRKLNDLKFSNNSPANEDCLISEVVELSPSHYDRFSSQLDLDYPWLKGKGGTCSDVNFNGKSFEELSIEEREVYDDSVYSICLLVFCDLKTPILIDPQGYSYCRYVARVTDEIRYKAIESFTSSQAKAAKENNEKIEKEYARFVLDCLENDRLSNIVSISTWASDK